MVTHIDKIKRLVIEAANKLQAHNKRLATAESCTGGGLSYWLTSVPGSSRWFERGHVTYSNDAKIALGVPASTLEQFGAVSAETAQAMANTLLQLAKTDFSIAITGIAGPDGGSATKPVGTVWIAWGRKNAATLVKGYAFTGDRQAVRLASIAEALEKLIEIMDVTDVPVYK